MSSSSQKQMRATAFVDALDAYLEAKAVYEKAAARCKKNYDSVIYDVVHVEQDAMDGARNNLVYAVRDIQD